MLAFEKLAASGLGVGNKKRKDEVYPTGYVDDDKLSRDAIFSLRICEIVEVHKRFLVLKTGSDSTVQAFGKMTKALKEIVKKEPKKYFGKERRAKYIEDHYISVFSEESKEIELRLKFVDDSEYATAFFDSNGKRMLDVSPENIGSKFSKGEFVRIIVHIEGLRCRGDVEEIVRCLEIKKTSSSFTDKRADNDVPMMSVRPPAKGNKDEDSDLDISDDDDAENPYL